MARELELGGFYSPFQPKPLCDSQVTELCTRSLVLLLFMRTWSSVILTKGRAEILERAFWDSDPVLQLCFSDPLQKMNIPNSWLRKGAERKLSQQLES